MVKFFSTIAVGAIFILMGLATTLVYFQSVSGSGSVAFLVIPIGLMAMGAGFIFWAIKDRSVAPAPVVVETSSGGGEDLLARNNAMASEYDKTTKTRDQLKMLEVSAAATKPNQ